MLVVIFIFNISMSMPNVEGRGSYQPLNKRMNSNDDNNNDNDNDNNNNNNNNNNNCYCHLPMIPLSITWKSVASMVNRLLMDCSQTFGTD